MTGGTIREFIRRVRRKPFRYLVWRAAKLLDRGSERFLHGVYYRPISVPQLIQRTGFTDRSALLESLGRSFSSGFFVDGAQRSKYCGAVRDVNPAAVARVVGEADRIVKHEFPVFYLGWTHLGDPIDWHRDFHTADVWARKYHASIDYVNLDRPSDVKVPWELSRFQFLTRLGQAYWFSGDERYVSSGCALVESWLQSNPVAEGIHWASTMEVAIRAVNFLWAYSFFLGASAFSPGVQERWIVALHQHARFIARNLERSDVNGNHYAVDLVALLLLGIWFNALPEAARWTRAARIALEVEVQRQIYPDGVDHEGSIPYHRLVCETFLTAALAMRTHGQPLTELAETRLRLMCDFTAHYTRPDGTAPLIGDGDDGRLQALGTQEPHDHRYLCALGALMFKDPSLKTAASDLVDEAIWLLGPDAVAEWQTIPAGPAAGSKAFAEGGFYVLRAGQNHMVVDCGDVGLRGRGGHGHNDALSFDCCADGYPLIVDPGCYTYTGSWRLRNLFRGTSAHNVLEVDDREIAALGGPDALWTIPGDALPTCTRWEANEHSVVFEGWHRGYAGDDPATLVGRLIWFDKDRGSWVIIDRLGGTSEHRLKLRLHLAPGVRPQQEGERTVLLRRSGLPDRRLLACLPTGYQVEILPYVFSPSYGRQIESFMVCVSGRSSSPVKLTYSISYPGEFGSDLMEDAEFCAMVSSRGRDTDLATPC